MEYLSINEIIENYAVSRSTIKRTIKKIKDNNPLETIGGSLVLRYEPMKNGGKKAFLLKGYLDKTLNNQEVQEPVVDPFNELPDNTITRRYIERLEKELDAKQQQIETYLDLEAQIMERFKEMQEALKRTQYQLQQQTEMTAKKELELKEIKDSLTVKAKDSNHTESFEDVVLSDDPNQLEGQTMMNFEGDKKEDAPDQENVDQLNQHRQDILKNILSKGEQEAEARRKRVQDQRDNLF